MFLVLRWNQGMAHRWGILLTIASCADDRVPACHEGKIGKRGISRPRDSSSVEIAEGCRLIDPDRTSEIEGGWCASCYERFFCHCLEGSVGCVHQCAKSTTSSDRADYLLQPMLERYNGDDKCYRAEPLMFIVRALTSIALQQQWCCCTSVRIFWVVRTQV